MTDREAIAAVRWVLRGYDDPTLLNALRQQAKTHEDVMFAQAAMNVLYERGYRVRDGQFVQIALPSAL